MPYGLIGRAVSEADRESLLVVAEAVTRAASLLSRFEAMTFAPDPPDRAAAAEARRLLEASERMLYGISHLAGTEERAVRGGGFGE